ncbi:4-O-dimethylallyl-L-tyrosine synthase [Colletotrichum aenigma]|uniref:4-O-dimethylallyl-L-tyrosine synthase n=1 Tax=Colletotrichum aenigma TaxID=1215731 RepID=UPI0018726DF9|nr:4-O-dimethylallyl-L-tyrosine synthase [Colletotrichum aenigma]KAF5525942.1 4-O-dimethylallyl-L-tyrosine synthase [Colletotrichum aenigma]
MNSLPNFSRGSYIDQDHEDLITTRPGSNSGLSDDKFLHLITSKLLRDAHIQAWDREVGETLSAMMTMAGYDDGAKAIHRGFFGTPRWESFMTDDHTPVELSWAWPDEQSTPTVRYSVEPIGWTAGSANEQAAASLLNRTRSYAQGLDLSWYRHFLRNGAVSSSQTFSAFDLENDGSTTVKSYFIPTVKASSLGISNLDLVEQAIQTLQPLGPECSSTALMGQFSLLKDFILCHHPTEQPVVEIVAIDCVNPTDSRVKIYIRSKNTTFGSMIDVMSLGGRLPFLSDTVMSSLKELWVAVFGSGAEDNVGALSRPLPTIDHRTSGILYYLELKPGAPLPKPKVYLPVRHYALGRRADCAWSVGLLGKERQVLGK